MCGPGILAPWEVEVGGLQMRGQPGQASETLGQSKQWEKKSASDWSSVEECLPRIQKTLASIPNAAKLVNKGICTNLRKGYRRIRMHCGDQLNNHTIKRVSMLY